MKDLLWTRSSLLIGVRCRQWFLTTEPCPATTVRTRDYGSWNELKFPKYFLENKFYTIHTVPLSMCARDELKLKSNKNKRKKCTIFLWSRMKIMRVHGKRESTFNRFYLTCASRSMPKHTRSDIGGHFVRGDKLYNRRIVRYPKNFSFSARNYLTLTIIKIHFIS